VTAELRTGGGLERTLPREAYLAPEYFAREKERIFCREWVCVRRAEELAAPESSAAPSATGSAASAS
jgi:phenylpropionate dioxygenase-like ring-hydroxylating dioxygenase large terminal subunit